MLLYPGDVFPYFHVSHSSRVIRIPRPYRWWAGNFGCLALGFFGDVWSGEAPRKTALVKQNNTHMTSVKRWCCFLNISNMTSKLDKKNVQILKRKQLHFDTISSSLRNHPFALLCPSTIYSIKSPSSFSPRCFDQTAFCLFKIRRISPRFRAYKRRPPPQVLGS